MASPILLNTTQLSSTVLNSAIKELSSSGALSSLPTLYASNDPQDTDLQPVVEDEEIPVIDFSLLTGGTPAQRSQVVRDLGWACQEWGFFMLVNHGIPERLREAVMDAVKGFFHLKVEEKGEYADTHVMNPIRYGTSVNTIVELDVRYWRDYLKVITHPEFNSPTKPPAFRNILQEYSTSERELARKLLKGIWESLGLEESHMKEALGLDSCFQIIVCNLYPPCPQPELAIGLPSHSDHSLLSALFQNGIDGLEVKHNGKWIRVKPLPSSYLINTGDQMELAMGNTRALDTLVIPAPQLVSCESPAAFRGMKYREFMEYQQSNRLKEKSVLDLLRL